jgi:catechol 2,3-dioxygenase-like lactoylglutathione lyase family enzyme
MRLSESFKTAGHPASTVIVMTVAFEQIGLVTQDLAASLAFYRRLGLAIPDGAEAEPHVSVDLAGGLRLAWDTVEVIRSFLPDYEPPKAGHRIGLAFNCGSAAGVDATYADLAGAGHQGLKEPWDAFWGQRYAVVLDPDGNSVELFAALG